MYRAFLLSFLLSTSAHSCQHDHHQSRLGAKVPVVAQVPTKHNSSHSLAASDSDGKRAFTRSVIAIWIVGSRVVSVPRSST